MALALRKHLKAVQGLQPISRDQLTRPCAAPEMGSCKSPTGLTTATFERRRCVSRALFFAQVFKGSKNIIKPLFLSQDYFQVAVLTPALVCFHCSLYGLMPKILVTENPPCTPIPRHWAEPQKRHGLEWVIRFPPLPEANT